MVYWRKFQCNLTCFQESVVFPVPNSIQRSTTADIVLTNRSYDDNPSKYFKQLRDYFSQAYAQWMFSCRTLNSFEHTTTMNPTVYTSVEDNSKTYCKALLHIATECGIWNCGEFANFAKIWIDLNNLLKQGYKAFVCSLNNLQIPDKGANHDHAFVVIEWRGKQAFVIDLWLALVTGQPFFGSVSEYINHLKADGRYVRHGLRAGHVVNTADIVYRELAGGIPNSIHSQYHSY